MIEIKHITAQFDRTLYLDQSIVLKSNEITLIEGESGCGKTTLLYIIGMLMKPKCAIYQYHHQIIKDENLYKQNVTYVMQNNDLIDYLTVEEHFNLSLSQQALSKDAMKDILDYVNLHISLNQQISTLSSGERQRLAIAIALSYNTQIILLDEPTAYLDSERTSSILNLLHKIAKENRIVVISSHDKRIEEFASTIYTIDNQKIILKKASNTFKEFSLKQDKQSLSYYLTYIGYYIKHHLFSILLNIFLVSLSITFILLSTTISNEFLSQQDQNLQNLSTNQVLLINSEEKKYDETAPLLNNDVQQDILSLEGVKGIYPYIQTTYHQEKINVIVCSYIDKDEMSDYEDIHFNSSSPYYMSHALYKVIQKETFMLDNTEYRFSGVLKKGYNISYQYENPYILYIPYQEIKEHKGNYIIVLNDYKKIDNVSRYMTQNYNVSIVNTENSSLLLSSYSLAQVVGKIACFILLMIAVVFLLIINNQTIKNQRHALAFLKYNSNQYGKIELIHYLLLLLESFVIFICSIVIQIGYIFVINQIYHVHISNMTDLPFSMFIILLFMIVVNIPTIYGLHFHNPIKEIR